MTIPLASLCVLVVAAGALVYVLSRLGALAGASAGEGRSERWLSVWLPITLALPLIVLALSAPGVDAANRTAPLNAFDALWPVFGLPAIAAAAGVFLVGMRSGAMSGEISGGGAPAMSQVGWGAGLVVGALACMICAAGRIGFFEGQVMLTAGVILLWMRLQGGDSDTKHDEAATFAAPTSNRGGARIFAMLALGLAFVVALAAVWAVRDASLRWLVWGVLAFATGAGVAVAAGGPRGGPHAAARAGVHLCAYALLLGVGARLTLPPVLGAIHAARGAREVGESALFGAAEVLAFTPQTPGFAAMTPEAVLLLLLPALGVVPERAGRFGAILALGAAIALLATRLFLTR